MASSRRVASQQFELWRKLHNVIGRDERRWDGNPYRKSDDNKQSRYGKFGICTPQLTSNPNRQSRCSPRLFVGVLSPRRCFHRVGAASYHQFMLSLAWNTDRSIPRQICWFVSRLSGLTPTRILPPPPPTRVRRSCCQTPFCIHALHTRRPVEVYGLR